MITAISWGLSDFLAAKAARSIGPIASAYLVNIVGALAFIIFFAIFLRPSFTFSMSGFAFAASAGVLITVGGSHFSKA